MAVPYTFGSATSAIPLSQLDSNFATAITLGSTALTLGTTTTTVVGLTLTSPTFTTPVLGTPSSGTLTNCTGLPISTGVSGLGTGVATALAVNTGSSGALVMRLRKLEPLKVSYEGAEFLAEPQEKRAFEQALASFRKGDFDIAQTELLGLLSRYPQTGYASAALFWIGNAKFVGKDYKGALASFQKLLTQDAAYARAPEALLALANCQLELKDNAGARKTLESLIADHARSEAADAAKERLARLK